MEHNVKIRVVEKTAEGTLGSAWYGFAEGAGRAFAWAIFAYVFLFWMLPNVPKLADENNAPTEQN